MELPGEEGLAEAVSSPDLVLWEDQAEDEQALTRGDAFEAEYPSSEYLDGCGLLFAAGLAVPLLCLYRRGVLEGADDVAEQDGHLAAGWLARKAMATWKEVESKKEDAVQ